MGSKYYCEDHSNGTLSSPNYTSVDGLYLQFTFSISHIPLKWPVSLCVPKTCINIKHFQAKADVTAKQFNLATKALKDNGILDNLYMYAPEDK
jgi:hypothetical protein